MSAITILLILGWYWADQTCFVCSALLVSHSSDIFKKMWGAGDSTGVTLAWEGQGQCHGPSSPVEKWASRGHASVEQVLGREVWGRRGYGSQCYVPKPRGESEPEIVSEEGSGVWDFFQLAQPCWMVFNQVGEVGEEGVGACRKQGGGDCGCLQGGGGGF